ncbi:MAG: hypothetical protein HC820_01095 [Hydrococcus sp. RM1_1_31]|nr:hypothetical protein [Hydrococcus sp. RM1_1_31]
MYFVLQNEEEFDEECRQELQEVLRICRDWVEDSDEPFDMELYDEDE